MSVPASHFDRSPGKLAPDALLATLNYLRHRAAVYLSESAATKDAAHRRRLIMLAARCQEMMAEREARGLRNI